MPLGHIPPRTYDTTTSLLLPTSILNNAKRRILVAIDGKEQSQKAFDNAITSKNIIKEDDVIMIVKVVNDNDFFDNELFDSSDDFQMSRNEKYMQKESRALLKRYTSRLKQLAPHFENVKIVANVKECNTRATSIGKVLTDIALDYNVSLVVCGGRNRGKVKSMLFGSVSSYLVKHLGVELVNVYTGAIDSE